MGENDDLVREFLVESYENLDRLDRDFLILEKDPANHECLGSIFRTIHTIKGTSGFFGFDKLQKLTHVGENLLSKLRDGRFTLNPTLVDALLAMVDAVRQMLGAIEATGGEGDGDYSPQAARLNALQEDGGASAAQTATPATKPRPDDDPLAALFAAPAPRVTGAPNEAAPAPAVTSPKHSTTPVHDAETKDEPAAQTLADTTIRVDVGLLDRLMNLVGELVLARNQILQFANGQEDKAITSTAQRLNLLTSELQEGVMKTRMQPIGNLWTKFPRVVRDLSLACGKQVRIEMEGSDTELDKTLLEAIKDPLTHIIRNAIDHGIESPEARVAAGKPAEGLLVLRAFHEGGQVNIEVRDDGGGINPEKVREKAISMGLITAEQAAKLLESQVIDLIFLPGLSTAQRVTNISGRGVGMDVVKTNIERIGGHIDVQSRFGLDTTLRVKIPLTLAIIPALIVTSGGERFAIPQVSLLELVRLDQATASVAIEQVYGAPVYRLRGQLLPLVSLNREFGLTGQAPDAATTIVVLQADDHRFGLIVDAVNDAEEIVVKPLSKLLKPLSVYAGATIMGDGKVALILDVAGMGRRAHAVNISAEQAAPEAVVAKPEDQHEPVLIFQSPDDGRMAVPVAMISRLEEISRSRVERVGGQEVVQYRGHILPLLRIFEILPERRKEPRNPDAGVDGDLLPVLIHTTGGRSVGLVVGRIIDTVDTSLVIQRAATRPGVHGCLIIHERITELLDITSVVQANLPGFYEQPQPAGAG